MAEDWLSDVQKYDPGADPEVVAGIVRYCGIALRKRDSALVSFSSDDEVARVRNNFLRKKLALDHSDDELNVAINSVGERMRGDNTKNRVTVYYLLSQAFDRHDTFRKAPGANGGTKPKKAKAAAARAEPAPVSEAVPAAAPVTAPGPQAEAAPSVHEAEPARVIPAEPVAPASFGRKAHNGPPLETDRNVFRAASNVSETPPRLDDDASGGFKWWPVLVLAVIVIAAVVAWQMR